MKAMRTSVKKRGRKPLVGASSKPSGRRSESIKKQREDIAVTSYIKALINGMSSYDEMPPCSSPLLGEPISPSLDNGSITPSLILPGLELQTAHSNSTIECYALSPFYSSSSLESENISDESSFKRTTNLVLHPLPSSVTLPDQVVKGGFLQFRDSLDYGHSVSPLNSYSDDQYQKTLVICDLVSGSLTTDNSSASCSPNYNRNCYVPSYLVSSLNNRLGSCMEHEMHKGGFCSFKGSGLLEEIVCGYV